MKKFLKLTHNWLGFLLSIIMLIALTTGVYLGAVDIIKRLDNKGQEYVELTAKEKAHIVDFAFNEFPQAQGVKLPNKQTPFVEIYSRDRSVFLTHDLIEIETQIKQKDPIKDFIFWFHRNFQLGDFGKALNAWAALLSTAIMFIGLYLWWLIRKGFRLKQTLPKNTKNTSLVKSHIQLGVIFSIPLLIMAFSGFYITYGVRGSTNSAQVKEDVITIGERNNWQSQIEQALDIWPQAELVSVSKPRKRRGDLPKKTPKNPQLIYQLNFNENAQSWLQQTDTIKINLQKAQLVSVQTFADKGITYQAKYLARFLHDGGRMPTWYVVLLVISSLVGIMMVTFGAVTFIRKNFLSQKQKVLTPAAP